MGLLQKFKSRKNASPLTDWLIQMSLQAMAAFLSKRVEAEDRNILNHAVLAGIRCCAGHFMDGSGKQIVAGANSISSDVLAFEVLAFSAYAVQREHYFGIYDCEDFEDVDTYVPKPVQTAYNVAFAALPKLIDGLTKWTSGQTWEVHLANTQMQSSFREAVEHLNGTIMMLDQHKEPQLRYGRPSLDLMRSLSVATSVTAFAMHFPKGVAETLNNLIAEYYLDVE